MYHKDIKMTPAEVTKKTEGEVLKNMYVFGYLVKQSSSVGVIK
jgi:hypothetical protein